MKIELMPELHRIASPKVPASLGSFLLCALAPFFCILISGCDGPKKEKKSPEEFLNELSRTDSAAAPPSDQTIAAKAEKLLNNKLTLRADEEPSWSSPTPGKSNDAIMVIDSVPDKPQQSLPVADDVDTPWMFDASTPVMTWEILYKANAPVGYTSKKSVASNRGGEPIVTTDFRSVVRYTKDSKEVRRELTINLTEKPNGEIININMKSQSEEDIQTFTTRVDGPRAILELTNKGAKQQTEIAWDKKTRGPFAIEQSLMRKPMRDSESRLVSFLDPFTGRVAEARLDAQSKYKSPIMLGKSKLLREIKVTTRSGEALSESTVWCDEDGVILKTYIPNGDLRTFQVDDGMYKEIESVFDLSFTSNTGMQLVIKPGKREAYLDAIESENQMIYRFRSQSTDPYGNLSNRCNQRIKSLDAFTSEVTVFGLSQREELPAGVDSSDAPTSFDLDLSSWLDLGSQTLDVLYTEFLSQAANEDTHLKVLSFAKRLSEKYESVGFNNEVRKLSTALSSNRLNSIEQSITLIALLRKDAIPARLAMGFAYDRSDSEPKMIFQAWVEYHHADWWWPIDPANPTKTSLLDRIKLKDLSDLSSDVRREITKLLELSKSGTITVQD